MLSPMVGVAAINSMLFAVYGSVLRFTAKDPLEPAVRDVFIAGALSGFVNGFFSCPMELVKIRLQNQVDSPGKLYNGPYDCIKKIIKTDGFKGLYRGLPTTLLRETPSYGAYFAAYELFCKLIPNSDPNEPSFGLLMAGGSAGVVGWLSTYPLDVVKTRLQCISESQAPKYKTMVNAFHVIAREEGYRVFFSGLGATAMRAFPTNAATFYGTNFI
jgi:solute carrier family 25 (mitochondrial carnitine/acylcarnitine transporter), member 20/29